jgi:hypothetical protein
MRVDFQRLAGPMAGCYYSYTLAELLTQPWPLPPQLSNFQQR